MAIRVVVLALAAAGCLNSSSAPCSDGRVCPAGTTCDDLHRVCVTEAQTQVCDGRANGAFCEFETSEGTCVDGICLVEDPDADGVSGTNDNCPLWPNVDQADGDKDGFGDICDRCPDLQTMRNHDEDDDSYGDDCDRCPGIADFQLDFNGDGVSFACEAFGGQWSLLYFEPFSSRGTWTARSGQVWTFDADSAAPVNVLDQTDLGLENPLVQLRSFDKVVVDIGFTSTDMWLAGDRFGITLVDAFGTRIVSAEVECFAAIGSPTDECKYIARFADGRVNSSELAGQFALSRLHVEFAPGLSGSIRAQVDGAQSGFAFAGPVPVLTAFPVVSASPAIRLRYFAAWAVQ